MRRAAASRATAGRPSARGATAPPRPGRAGRARAVILPLVLLILVLIGLLVGGFAFRVHADRSSINAVALRLHTRLAAEAGIEKVLLGLRTLRADVSAWYDNPDELNRIIVWTPEEETLWGTNEELDEGALAYRFSIVADDPFDDEERSRFGITDESARLNLNTATPEQLTRLISQIATEEMVVEELVDALLDWRDEDEQPREFGAEFEYYGVLDTPYRPKNGPFDTVEELLMVRGFDGRVLYGEDHDRNGLLGPNEDDGDESFPDDDGDGELNRGLYPYVTVLSYDTNTDSQNRPRINLYGDTNALGTQLAEVFPDQPDKAQFIVSALSSGDGEGEDGGEGEPGGEQGAEGEDEAPGDSGEGEGNAGGENEERSLDENTGAEGEGEGEGEDPEGEGGGSEQSGDGDESDRLRSPADLLTVASDGSNPLAVEDLPVLMDRLTTTDPLAELPGLINVLTAPPRVLRCVSGLSAEEVAGIVQVRADLDPEERRTTAWLVTREVLTLEKYQQVAPDLTVNGRQFTIEALGYADHAGIITRLQVIVEMRGPVPQVVYYRDLTALGSIFPIREGEGEYGFGGTSG